MTFRFLKAEGSAPFLSTRPTEKALPLTSHPQQSASLITLYQLTLFMVSVLAPVGSPVPPHYTYTFSSLH